MDKHFFKEAPYFGLEFIKNLQTEEQFTFKPANDGLTIYGESLSLGFSCLALKSYFMTSEWDKLTEEQKTKWSSFINSFQVGNSRFPKNSFVDREMVKSYMNISFDNKVKYQLKKILNILPNFNFDSADTRLNKAINAETKQAISTLYEVGFSNKQKVNEIYFEGNSIVDYLNNLDWSKPWASGAQFSSVCVFSTTQNLGLENELELFIDKIANKTTGSYFLQTPNSNREVINGAMKVISGLDWLGKEIHYPKQLIDFCLNNSPILEGCDVVDFVYVLYKCSRQENYRKKEITLLFENILNDIQKLYVEQDGGFSYFIEKSQTHYYGVEITKGLKCADIHSTTLCIWAILMILDLLEEIEPDMNIIKP